MSKLTPSQREQQARLADYAMHARNDPRDTTRKAREAFLQRFEDEVDPDRSLPARERERRAAAARKAHFVRLALRSSQVRRSRRPERDPDSPNVEASRDLDGEVAP